MNCHLQLLKRIPESGDRIIKHKNIVKKAVREDISPCRINMVNPSNPKNSYYSKHLKAFFNIGVELDSSLKKINLSAYYIIKLPL